MKQKQLILQLAKKTKLAEAEKPKTFILQKYSFCFCGLSEAVALNFLPFVTLSSAAVRKLIFCGNLLRSKTKKKRLTNCRAHEVRGAAAPCYVILFCDEFAEAGGKFLLCLSMQTNTPKNW